MATAARVDPNERLQPLYKSLVFNAKRFDEFQELLALYDIGPDADPRNVAEPERAAEVRARLNERIRVWVGNAFEGLTARETLVWRRVLLEER